MMVTNPLPISLLLLNVALPGAWLSGRALARRAVDDPAVRLGLAPAFTVALLLTAIHVPARTFRSFSVGLVLGMTLLGVLGYAIAFVDRRDATLAPRLRPNWRLLGTALAATALIAPAALSWYFHDEVSYNRHTSISSQIQDDHYPPHDITFAERELRYHYGVDLLIAVVTALTRVDVPLAIDLVTLASWFYSWCLLGLIGERIVGPGRGILTAAVTLMGAGLPWLGTSHETPGLLGILGLGQVGPVSLNPPIISYAFQHPWGLGQPLALGSLLIHICRSTNRPGRCVGVCVLFVSLSFTQIVLFATFAASFAAAEAWADRRAVLSRRFAGPVCALVSGIIATRIGGFFLPSDAGGSGLFVRPGIVPTVSGTLRWHLLTLGLLIPLGVVGFRRLRGGRLFLGLLVAGSLGVLNVLEYVHSWDIAKFAAVTSLALAIPAAASLGRLAEIRPRLLGLVLAGTLFIGTVSAGVAFPLVFALDLPGIPAQVFPRRLDPVTSSDAQVISWLRPRVGPGESVYRAQPASGPYAQRGGLPVPWFDSMTESDGYSKDRLHAREVFLRNPPDDPDAFIDRRIRWLVLAPSDETMNEHVGRWISAGRAEIVKSVGRLRVVHLRREGER